MLIISQRFINIGVKTWTETVQLLSLYNIIMKKTKQKIDNVQEAYLSYSNNIGNDSYRT